MEPVAQGHESEQAAVMLEQAAGATGVSAAASLQADVPGHRFRLDDFLPYRLNELAARVSRSLAQVYAERFELTIPQWRIVATLQAQPGLTARDVARRTGLDKVSTSRALAGLVERSLVLRRASARDARASELRLSARGARLFQRIAPLALAWEQDLLAPLGTAERRQLRRLLDKLGRGVDGLSCDPAGAAGRGVRTSSGAA